MSRSFPLASATFALVLALTLAPAVPPVAAQAPTPAMDAIVTLEPGQAPVADAPPGLLRLNASQPGERYRFDLTLERNYTTIEVRANGMALERARQIVPSLVVPEDQYPLLGEFPNERIWEVEAPVNVSHTSGTGDAAVLRIGLAGPGNVTLAIDVDRAPPAFTLGPVENVTHFSFYQETTTDELALADLQIRKVGGVEWIQNPTPSYHFRQRFPVQGLDPATDYEAQVVFTDWAGNAVASGPYAVRSAPAPESPLPRITPLAPAPNATVAPGTVTVRALVEANESPVAPGGVRLFFDKREVTPDVEFDGREVRYTPSVLVKGRHSVGVEVTNEAGGTGIATWSFEAGDPSQTPVPWVAALVAAALGAAFATRRARRA